MQANTLATSPAVNALFTGEQEKNRLQMSPGFSIERVTTAGKTLDGLVDALTRSFAGTTLTAPDAVNDWMFSGRQDKVFEPLAEPPSQKMLEWTRERILDSLNAELKSGGCYALVHDAQ